MSFDPYAELSIPRAASPAEVKRAYRKRAKDAHPDAGGTAEDFNRLSRAFLVLSDPVRRAKYDHTGEVDEREPDNALSIAVSIIVGYFSAAVSDCISKGRDPCGMDLVATGRAYFEQQIKLFTQQKQPIEKAAKAMEKVEKRLRGKGKANPIVRHALLAQVRSTAEPLRALDQKIQQFRDALVLLENYEFDVDSAVAPRPASQIYTWSLG